MTRVKAGCCLAASESKWNGGVRQSCSITATMSPVVFKAEMMKESGKGNVRRKWAL